MKSSYVYPLACALTSLLGVALTVVRNDKLMEAATAIRPSSPAVEDDEPAVEAPVDVDNPGEINTNATSPPVTLTSIGSSGITSVGYAPEDQVMEVHFSSGRVWWYYNVPQAVYQGFLNARFRGQYFNKRIGNAGFARRQAAHVAPLRPGSVHNLASAHGSAPTHGSTPIHSSTPAHGSMSAHSSTPAHTSNSAHTSVPARHR
jgi:hypothetical protein